MGTGKAAIEHEPPTSLRIGCGKQRRQRAAFGYAQLRCTLNSGSIHDRPDIVHAQVQRRNLGDWIGEARAALVEHHDAGEAA